MLHTKRKIIHQNGQDVSILRPSTNTVTLSRAIIGRLNRSGANMVSLESQREGIFFPDIELDSGDFVTSVLFTETYVVVSTLPEPWKNQKIATVAGMAKCNGALTIGSLVQKGDLRGNLKAEFVASYLDIPCYLQQVDDKLKQYDSGLHPDTEYKVYTTSLTVKETDKAVITVLGANEDFKVLSKDYVSFPGLVVLQLCRDIRK